MNEKIRVVVDLCTPTVERRPTTIEDIYSDFEVLEFNSKEELADELARMNGYKNLKEFKQELVDGGVDLDDYDFEGDELNKSCEYLLAAMTDPGDGSPNIQYISINGKPAYEDYWMTYDTFLDNMELLARGSKEAIITYYLEYNYDYVEDEDDYEDDEELEESFKSKDKYSVLREALDRLDEVYLNKPLKESTVYNYVVRYDGWVEPLYITSVNPFDLGKKKDAYKFNSFDDAFNAWEELCKDPKFRDDITNDTNRTIFKIKALG